jgi:hypothetical protein
VVAVADQGTTESCGTGLGHTASPRTELTQALARQHFLTDKSLTGGPSLGGPSCARRTTQVQNRRNCDPAGKPTHAASEDSGPPDGKPQVPACRQF